MKRDSDRWSATGLTRAEEAAAGNGQLIVATSSPGTSFAAARTADCRQIRLLDLDETSLIEGPDAGSNLFGLEVPVPGFLAVEERRRRTEGGKP